MDFDFSGTLDIFTIPDIYHTDPLPQVFPVTICHFYYFQISTTKFCTWYMNPVVICTLNFEVAMSIILFVITFWKYYLWTLKNTNIICCQNNNKKFKVSVLSFMSCFITSNFKLLKLEKPWKAKSQILYHIWIKFIFKWVPIL